MFKSAKQFWEKITGSYEKYPSDLAFGASLAINYPIYNFLNKQISQKFPGLVKILKFLPTKNKIEWYILILECFSFLPPLADVYISKMEILVYQKLATGLFSPSSSRQWLLPPPGFSCHPDASRLSPHAQSAWEDTLCLPSPSFVLTGSSTPSRTFFFKLMFCIYFKLQTVWKSLGSGFLGSG